MKNEDNFKIFITLALIVIYFSLLALGVGMDHLRDMISHLR